MDYEPHSLIFHQKIFFVITVEITIDLRMSINATVNYEITQKYSRYQLRKHSKWSRGSTSDAIPSYNYRYPTYTNE